MISAIVGALLWGAPVVDGRTTAAVATANVVAVAVGRTTVRRAAVRAAKVSEELFRKGSHVLLGKEARGRGRGGGAPPGRAGHLPS